MKKKILSVLLVCTLLLGLTGCGNSGEEDNVLKESEKTNENVKFENIDVITFVPMGKKGLRERGFNQAEEIANEISKIMNIPVFGLLRKTREHKHQAGLNQKDRLENLKGTFEIISDYKSKIKGERILIIDDVFTTGATLSECAKTIKEAKPKSVSALTFAKTKLISIN